MKKSYLKEAESVIRTEIKGLEALASNLDHNFDSVVEAIKKSDGRVVITGMGKSGLVGKKMAATMASTGTPSFFMHPGEAYHGDLGMIGKDDIVIAISNSGETEEVIRLLSFFKDNKNVTVAMSAKNESTLAKHCDYFLNIKVPKEACPLALAPTTSTTVTMALGDALAVALMSARDFKEENFARFHPGGSLGRRLLTRVKDVMRTENLPFLKPEMLFDEVVSVISSGYLGIGIMLEDDKVKGVITDGDIRRALQNEKEKALTLKALDFLTTGPLTIDAEEKIIKATELMQEKKITALLVTENEKFKGVLHLYDL